MILSTLKEKKKPQTQTIQTLVIIFLKLYFVHTGKKNQAKQQTKHHAHVKTDLACNYFAEVKALLYFGEGVSSTFVLLNFVGWIRNGQILSLAFEWKLLTVLKSRDFSSCMCSTSKMTTEFRVSWGPPA